MEILYADDRVVVCIKPAGVLSTDEPGGMPELLRFALGDERAVVRTVHRLDRVVGGLMVYARTSRAAADLEEQMRSGAFRKQYLAVAHGCPTPESGVWQDHLRRDKRERKTYLAQTASAETQEAALEYRLLERAGEISLVNVKLHTGRTHQIRCQFSGRGLPLAGDRKYGAEADECGIGLWSYKLEFLHPRTGEKMSFVHLPPDVYPWSTFKALKTGE